MSLERCRLAFVNNERQQRNACNNHNTLIPSILGFSVFITIIYYLFPHSVFFSPLHRNLTNISKIFFHLNWKCRSNLLIGICEILSINRAFVLYIMLIDINKQSFDIYLIYYAAMLFHAALFGQFVHT